MLKQFATNDQQTRPKKERRPRGSIPVIDCWLPRCVKCGDAIERYNGGTRPVTLPGGQVVMQKRTKCNCGQVVKINFR